MVPNVCEFDHSLNEIFQKYKKISDAFLYNFLVSFENRKFQFLEVFYKSQLRKSTSSLSEVKEIVSVEWF